MKKILIGFIAIGILTFVGCDKNDDTDTTSAIKYGDGATDIDGNSYKTVIIGNQEWMASNLRTTKYFDGTTIPNVTDNNKWSNLSTGAWSHYDNDSQYDNTYGKLYNWHAVETKKLCPAGWHVPTDAEWRVLTDYLAANGHSGTEGTALKSKSGWSSGGMSGNGTDDYGWLGLPNGRRDVGNGFYDIGTIGDWWSSSDGCTGAVLNRGLESYTNTVYTSCYVNKKNGLSVRCLRN